MRAGAGASSIVVLAVNGELLPLVVCCADEKIDESGPIEVKVVADVQAEPYALPAGFEWSDCDMTDAKTVCDAMGVGRDAR